MAYISATAMNSPLCDVAIPIGSPVSGMSIGVALTLVTMPSTGSKKQLEYFSALLCVCVCVCACVRVCVCVASQTNRT